LPSRAAARSHYLSDVFAAPLRSARYAARYARDSHCAPAARAVITSRASRYARHDAMRDKFCAATSCYARHFERATQARCC